MDVAEVVDSAEDARDLASFDGKRALTLLVRKQSDANSVAVADEVLEAVAQGKFALPPGYRLAPVQDTATFTRHAIDDVIFDLIFGAFLAVMVIMLFLRDGRATFISALALPTSVVATFAFMRVMGFTSNVLTMMALSLSIGMLIDDAIVVIENIHRHREMGKSPLQAARDGTAEIGLAVLATTLTIVAVFVPVATMEGIAGRIFYEFGMTVAFAVAVSLFVSFTLTPMASSKLLGHHRPGKLSKAVGAYLDIIDQAYRRAIAWVLDHRKTTVGAGVAAFVVALALAPFIPTEFMSAMDQGELDVGYFMPEGASVDVSYERGEDIARLARASVPELRHTLVLVGTGQRRKVNEGKVFLKLLGSRDRKRSQDAIATDLRQRFAKAFPGIEIAVSRASAAGQAGGEMMSRPLNIQLRGDDTVLLRKTAQKLIAQLYQHKGFVDLTLTDRGSRPQFGVALDRDKISEAGLMPVQVAMTIRTAINGTETSQYREGSDRYKVIVVAPDRYHTDRNAVLSVPLRGPMGNLVEVGEVVRPFPEDAASQIDREDRVRQVTILGNLEGLALGPAQTIAAQVAKDIVPRGVELAFTGQGKMMKETFANMISALVLAIVLIYMVLAAQFESFLHPLVIMVSLPLSLVGALGALFLTRNTLSMMSFIGIIMLMGLVTKNAILLVDRANQKRASGQSIRDAIAEAGATRLRPILMTTAAMIFGMFPVALGLGEGSEMRVPMGVAVIGGLIASTLLTLLVVPAIYSLAEAAKGRVAAWLGARAEPEPVTAAVLASRHGAPHKLPSLPADPPIPN